MSDGAVSVIVSGFVQITVLVIGFLTLWIKLRHGVDKATEALASSRIVEGKVDSNTELTRSVSHQATQSAKAAEQAADRAIEMSERLNGSLDEKIRIVVREYVDPLTALFKAHSEQDERNMVEIRQALNELRDRTK